MIKKFLNKVMAVMLGAAVISVSVLNVNAAEIDSNESAATGELQPLSANDDTILPPDISYIKQYFTMDMPTGSGSGEFVLNQHYYDFETAHGYKPAITVSMGTNVTCDMGAKVKAQDSWGDIIYFDKDAYQTTSFYGRAQGVNLNSVYILREYKIWCCDDVDRGTITYGATESK